eukprot:TRINITY_DN1963_c0_g2_i1.p1 TRINITY_DN1963_c0_g2~~TRINITY_DN1963_c0_g2_i1.p1  ORF type:complete len:686 (-),score=138.42 TRINITY_DN1963_c0_g2_i1:47-2104(-)
MACSLRFAASMYSGFAAIILLLPFLLFRIDSIQGSYDFDWHQLQTNRRHSYLPESFQFTKEGNSSKLSPCQIALNQMINGTLPNADLMGVFSGTGLNDIGMYDSCQNLTNAHYCLLQYIPIAGSNLNFSTGLCVPIECGNADLLGLLDQIVLDVDFTNLDPAVNCARKTYEKPDWQAIVVFSFLALLFLLAFLGGIIEYRQNKLKEFASKAASETDPLLREKHSINEGGSTERKSPFIVRFLLCFSPITNLEKLLVPTSVPHLASLNGLRTLSMLWVIMGHSIYWASFTTGYANPEKIRFGELQDVMSQIIINAPYSVDAFFYMSGFLVTYLSQKELEKKGRLPMFLYYFHRVWRLTPPYFVALLVLWKCLPYFGKGPFWFQVDTYVSRTECDKYWWTNLLYVNNFVPNNYDETCMGWSWYLANDMQLYILTPIFIFLFYKFKLIGWIALGLCCGASLGMNFYYTWAYKFSPYLPLLQEDVVYMTTIYTKFYARASAWLVGIAAAWILIWHEKRRDKRIPVYVQILLYAFAAFLLGSTVFGTVNLNRLEAMDPPRTWSRAEDLLYLTFGRCAFATGVAIVMHMTYTGYGYFIHSLLSLYVWDVMARLTYSAYLYHPILLSIAYYGSTQLYYYGTVSVLTHFLAFAVLAFTAALVSFLLIERPMMNLEKLMHPPPKRTTAPTANRE